MLDQILAAIKAQPHTRIVSCPLLPIEIPGIAAADAIDADDCMGTPFNVLVPKSGIIFSATLIDLDDEGTQVDLMIFNDVIPTIGNDSAWSPADVDMSKFVTALEFDTFIDHAASQTSEIVQIDKAYAANSGRFTIQAVDRSGQTIAAGSMPKVQLHIITLDMDFIEV